MNQKMSSILLRVNLEQVRHQNISNETILVSSEDNWTFMRHICVYSYTSITIATILVTLASCFMFYKTSTKASSKLHNEMFQSIMNATMRFFNTNPAGRILNRFSKDIETVDIILPYALINCLQVYFCYFIFFRDIIIIA